MPDVRKQIATSDGAVKRRAAACANVCATLVFLLAGCGPMIQAAPFPVRPDSVRPADLLGPYDGIVVDADSDRPIAGATVAASWAFERGIGLRAPAGAQEFVTETGADGRYIVPKLADLPSGASMRVRRFTLIVYHRGHIAWRSDRLFPGREARRDFSQRGSRVRLERWQPALRHAEHVVFVGGGLVFIIVGNLCAWHWVNVLWLRLAHLAAIAIVVAEAWFGAVCPLTSLEMWLRAKARATTYTGSFIEHWLQRFIFFDAPFWVFTAAYTVFALMVFAAWWYFPPRRRRATSPGEA
jgi:hypothetical protein